MSRLATRRVRALLVGLLLAAGLTAAASAPALAAAGPANDDISAATRVRELPFGDSVDLTAATDDPRDPTTCFPAHSTVWYRITPATAVDIEANTFGSDFDTTLSVFTGSPDALSLVACNDDTASAQSRVRFSARAAVRYWVMLGSYYSGFAGVASLDIHALPPPLAIGVSVSERGRVDRTGVATVRGRVTCSRPVEVTVVGSLRQRRGSAVSLGYFTATVACAGSSGWTAVAPGETGRFRAGTATAKVTALSFDAGRDEVVRAYVARSVRLSRP